MAENGSTPKWQRIDWDYMEKRLYHWRLRVLFKEFADRHGINYSNVRQKAATRATGTQQKSCIAREKTAKFYRKFKGSRSQKRYPYARENLL